MKQLSPFAFVGILFCFLTTAYAEPGIPAEPNIMQGYNNQFVQWIWFDQDSNSYLVYLKPGSEENSPIHFPQKEVHLKLDVAVSEPVLKIGGHDGKKITIIFQNVERLKCALTGFKSSEQQSFDKILQSNPCHKKIMFPEGGIDPPKNHRN